MTIDAIVGRPSNLDKFNRDQFAYDDVREAFDLFVKEVKYLGEAGEISLETFTEVVHSLKSYRYEPAYLASRSLRWALSNRKHYVK
jgi:hypothetical protein